MRHRDIFDIVEIIKREGREGVLKYKLKQCEGTKQGRWTVGVLPPLCLDICV